MVITGCIIVKHFRRVQKAREPYLISTIHYPLRYDSLTVSPAIPSYVGQLLCFEQPGSDFALLPHAHIVQVT